MRVFPPSFAALLALPAIAGAQSTGQSRAAIFLTLPTSARALALGDAYGAIANDEGALFYNPAQLAQVRSVTGGGSLQRYIAETTLGAFAIAAPIGRGTVAVGMQLLDYGSAEEYVPAEGSAGQQGVPTGGRVSAQDLALMVGYGMAFGERHALRAGVTVKYARQHVANYSGGAAAADVGVAYSLRSGWELAGAMQQLGSNLTLASVTAQLPWTWRVDAASPVLRGDRYTLRGLVEARQWSGGLATGVLAAEGTWRDGTTGAVLAARAGYALRGSGDDRSPMTLGGGVTLGRFTVDYAYEGFELLGGATHRVGIRYAAARVVTAP